MVATAENIVPVGVGATEAATAKVLFVDDEPANLVVCDAACSDAFQVLTAQNGAAALDVMRREEVAVIVADQRMPGMTGV